MDDTAIEKIYNTINEVLEEKEQEGMLCMLIPGTVLDKECYVCDNKFEKNDEDSPN